MSAATNDRTQISIYPAGTQSHWWMIEKLEFYPGMPEEKKPKKKSSWIDKQIKRRGWK